jgi:hypothetical protein
VNNVIRKACYACLPLEPGEWVELLRHEASECREMEGSEWQYVADALGHAADILEANLQ